MVENEGGPPPEALLILEILSSSIGSGRGWRMKEVDIIREPRILCPFCLKVFKAEGHMWWVARGGRTVWQWRRDEEGVWKSVEPYHPHIASDRRLCLGSCHSSAEALTAPYEGGSYFGDNRGVWDDWLRHTGHHCNMVNLWGVRR